MTVKESSNFYGSVREVLRKGLACSCEVAERQLLTNFIVRDFRQTIYLSYIEDGLRAPCICRCFQKSQPYKILFLRHTIYLVKESLRFGTQEFVP